MKRRTSTTKIYSGAVMMVAGIYMLTLGIQAKFILDDELSKPLWGAATSVVAVVIYIASLSARGAPRLLGVLAGGIALALALLLIGLPPLACALGTTSLIMAALSRLAAGA